MADFVEIMKIRNRMCNEIKYCSKCPIGCENNGTGHGCPNFLRKYPEKAQKILLKWDKHIFTNADKFEEVFGHKVKNNECPLIGTNECMLAKNCDNCPNKGFWKKQYKVLEVK